MSVIIPNEFTSYSFTEQEQLEGSSFTVLQKEVLQNQLSMLAAEKNNLDFDPAEPLLFTQAEAYKKGQIDTIKYILANSDAAQDILYPPTPDRQEVL